jgi:hypothetical protein
MDLFETAMKIIVALGALGIGIGIFASAIRLVLGRPSRGRLWLEHTMQQRQDPGLTQDMAELRRMVEHLNGDVGELQERLDFAERMLAQQRERPALPDR